MVAKTKAKKWTKKSSKRAKPKAKGKKRKTFKKVARKTYKRKSFKRSSRRTSAKLISSGLGDQALLINFVDSPQFANTTNAVANQFVWASNCVASGANVTVGQHNNLLLDAGNHLEAMFTSASDIVRGSTAGQAFFNPPSGAKDFGATMKIIRKTAEVQCRIVNLQTAAVELWEYRIMAMRDQTILPGALFYQAGQMESNATVSYATANGTSVAPAAVAGGGYPTPVGVTPFMIHAFVQQYKILKVKKRELRPNGKLHLKYSLKKPRMYNWANLCSTVGGPGIRASGVAATGVPFVVRKGQVLSMFWAKGTYATEAINVAANAGFTRGISNIALGIEYQYRYHWNFVQTTSSAATSIPSMPGFSDQAAAAPLPIVANWPIATITAATGVVTYANNARPGAPAIFDTIETPV